MNYNELRKEMSSAIDFFSDGDGVFKCITQQGSVQIVNGREVELPEVSVDIKGLIRSPRIREVDGEAIMITDKLGIFNADVPLEKGYLVEVDGERYMITQPRPVRQTTTTLAYRPILRRVAEHG